VAESSAAKVETQYREPKAVQRLHGMEHNLVMQRPTKQRVWMANYRGVRRVFPACIQQRFQPSCGAFEEERFDG